MRAGLFRILGWSTRRSTGAFSLPELVTVVAVLSITGALGIGVASRVRDAARDVKLENDVAAINAAARAYMANGGSLPSSLTPAEVLERLKTQVTGDDAVQLVGHRGPFMDQRVQGRPLSGMGKARAVWNGQLGRFELRTSGTGFEEFYLDQAAGAAAPKTESRSTVFKFAKLMGWVWDFDGAQNSAPAVPAPAETSTSVPIRPTFTPPANASAQRLAPPTFSIPGGMHPYEKFPLPLILTNPNPAGTSSIMVSLNNGPWQAYDGKPIELPKNALNIGVNAYCMSSQPDSWLDSDSRGELYQTIYFIGQSSGFLHSPLGDSGLVTNLVKGLTGLYFEWGSPAVPLGYTKPNSLTFKPEGKFGVVPDQEFKIGELTYYNGTTYSGTNATSVKMRVKLDLEVPRGTEELDFTLRLLSTPNLATNTLDQSADYVWIPNVATGFSTQIQGQTYYLQLRFGNSTANGFTKVDEFHVHENKSATGTLFGRLTTNPTNPVKAPTYVQVDTSLPSQDGWSNNTVGVKEDWKKINNWSSNWGKKDGASSGGTSTAPTSTAWTGTWGSWGSTWNGNWWSGKKDDDDEEDDD